MKKILGLDLGVSSIGWAIVAEDENKTELLNAGVRIIPLDSDTTTKFSEGKSTSKNADRRVKRSARRNNHRYKLRKHFLIEFLKENNLYPLPEAFFNLKKKKERTETDQQEIALWLYELRDRAIREKISKEELARIWFHLNQKRGYIDNRKGVSKEDKDEEGQDTEYVKAIKNRSKNLYTNEIKTVGSYFYHKLLGVPLYRVKSGDDKENIFLVDDYKLEFDLIWNKQKEFYPDFLNEVNYERVRNKIIYYKRKLKSQKHLIGNCRFEKQHKCMPISSPVAQELRLWQDVNKLRIKNQYHEEFELTKEQKTDLFDFLIVNEKISQNDLLARYNYPSTRKGHSVNFEKQLTGYVFRVRLLKLFDKYKIDFSPYAQFDATQNEYSKHPFFMLWHLLYSIDEPTELKKTLKEKYSFEDDLITDLMKLPIKNDFASLSSRAARKILPFLREGKIYSDACNEVRNYYLKESEKFATAGNSEQAKINKEMADRYNHSNSITSEENAERKLILINKPLTGNEEYLMPIKPNDLKNPTVEKILNQLINLLKALDADGQQFDEIRIELARDLKKNAKERQGITKRNRENETENKNIKEELLKHGFNRVSKKDIEKYKLWKEFDRCSPYEPNTTIELGQLFEKAMYEIEHIIPKCRYFDDSFNNKTIARVHINRKEKDNQTAYDYMCSKSDELKHQFEECIKRNTKISRRKKEYLMMAAKDIPDDFINRQLNETRYITSETLKLLKTVCRNVYSTTGTVTDYLKHHWGYDDILMELNFERVAPEEIEIVEKEGGKKRTQIKNWSKRLDHRHHAVDAVVIAATKQSYINQLNSLNKFIDNPTELKSYEIRNKAPFSFEEVKKQIDNILISYKAGKKVATIKKVGLDKWGKAPKNIGQITLVPRGSLHEETVYGKIKTHQTINIKDLNSLSQVVKNKYKNLILKHIERYDNDLQKALKNLKKDPIKINDKQTLNTILIFEPQQVVKYPLEYNPQGYKFDIKGLEKVVDKKIKEILIERLGQYENDPAKAFKNLKANPVYLNKEANIQIKSVRKFTGGIDYPALHETANGKTLNDKLGKGIENKKPVDFIIQGNNHHIAIYEDEQGERIEKCVTFFEAFERKTNKIPVIDKNHPKGYKFLFSIQQNEMFVYGMSKEELEQAIEQNNFSLISKYLFRVNDIQKGCYFLLHHLKTDKDKAMKERKLKKVFQCSVKTMSSLKVRVSRTGKISLIND